MIKSMRKETRLGLLLFAGFNILNLVANEIGIDIPLLHFCLGVLTGLAFSQVIIGLLPESVYNKVTNFKNIILVIKR